MANDYKVLYRKYRPSSFDEVIGQKYTIRMLKNAIINDKISHAYIFTGPRGTGKTSTAKIFAKTINCEHPKDGIPCGECNSCLNIENNADIIEIDAASNTGVDEIRELINNVKIAPSFSKYKVYIIDEVHMLTQNAFNALLLTLEEPPSHIVFILATTNIESVPITILSRCQRYDFKKIENEDLIIHLKNVCEKEKIQITEDAIEEIVYLCEGGCRDALSILNQLSTSNSSIDLDVVLSNYGSVSLVQIKEIIQSFLNNDYSNLEEIFKKIEKSSIDYKIFIKKMVDQLFNEALKCKINGENEKYATIKSVIFELNDLINKININIDPFLLIFMILANSITTSGSTEKVVIKEDETSATLEKRKLEKNAFEKKTVSEEELKNEEVINSKQNIEFENYINKLKEVRINNCFSKADKTLLNGFKEKWEKFAESIPIADSLKSLVIDAEVVLASEDINIVTNAQNSMVDLFNHELSAIEKNYESILNKKILFIAVSPNEWEEYKKDYIKKIKENYVYKILEEPVYIEDEQDLNRPALSSSTDEVLSSDYTDVLTIFNEDHVVIE